MPIARLEMDKIADQTISEMADPKLELFESTNDSPPSINISMAKRYIQRKLA